MDCQPLVSLVVVESLVSQEGHLRRVQNLHCYYYLDWHTQLSQAMKHSPQSANYCCFKEKNKNKMTH